MLGGYDSALLLLLLLTFKLKQFTHAPETPASG
jgi:hypothetical protein